MTVEFAKHPCAVQQRRTPGRKIFHGLSGSPLAEVIPFPEQPQQSQPEPAPKRGRPRKHTDNASKQKTYRERRSSIAIIGERVAKQPRVSSNNTLMIPIHEKWFMPGADHGKGQYITGGYDSKKIEQVQAAIDRDLNGRRVRPKGHAPYADEPEDANSGEKGKGAEKIENGYTFSHKIRFPKNDKLTDYEKEKILIDFARENTEEEPCPESEDVAEKYRDQYHTTRCLLCNATLGVSFWPLSCDGFTLPHFMSNHLRPVQKTWKTCAPKVAPKRCSGDHVGAAQRLRDTGAVGNYYCKKCKRLILGVEFRIEPPMYVNQNTRNELTSKINASPIRGKGMSYPPASQPGTNSAKSTTMSLKEVA
jgi:hypothetical protein